MDELAVLCIDDEPGMRSAVLRTLDGYSCELPEHEDGVRFAVRTAGSAEEGMDALTESGADLLLLDYKLPGISGLDLLRRIEKERRDLVTIMITAYASIETAVEATKRGAFDFIAKPFTPEELKAVVRRAARQCILQRRAHRAEQDKRRARHEVVSTVAHELKAPLAAVEANLNIVRERTAGDDPALYDHLMGRCIERLRGMRKLIVDLMDLTRIESGESTRKLTRVDLRKTAAAAIETVADAAEARRVAIHLETEGDCELVADAREMEIVLTNFVSNAVKYNREGGEVRVSVCREPDCVRIEVRDTGIGLTEEEAARLFADFVRIRNDDTKDILGTGLGLSIVKRIVGLYGGSVSAGGERGVGSTFTAVIPVAEMPE